MRALFLYLSLVMTWVGLVTGCNAFESLTSNQVGQNLVEESLMPPPPAIAPFSNGVANDDDDWKDTLWCADDHCCSVYPDSPDEVWCWGNNNKGQLANTNFTSGNSKNNGPVSVELPAGINAVRLGTGASSTNYFLTDDHRMFAVGGDADGELCNPNITSGDSDVLVPTFIGPTGVGAGASGIIHMEAGDKWVLAVNENYQVFSCGKNDQWRMGTGTKSVDVPYLTPVIGYNGSVPNGSPECCVLDTGVLECSTSTDCDDAYAARAVEADDGWSTAIEFQDNDSAHVLRGWGLGSLNSPASAIGLHCGDTNAGAKHPGALINCVETSLVAGGLHEKWVSGTIGSEVTALLDHVIFTKVEDDTGYQLIDEDEDGWGVPYSTGDNGNCERALGLTCSTSSHSHMALPMRTGANCDQDFPDTAVKIATLSGGVAVLDNTGTLYTAGINEYGATGQGTTTGNTTCLTAVSALSSVTVRNIASTTNRSLLAQAKTSDGKWVVLGTGKYTAGVLGNRDGTVSGNTGGSWIQANTVNGNHMGAW